MTRRYYQLFALALLIGAPLLVNLLSNFVPGIHPLGPPAAQAAVTPDYMQPSANPEANLPKAQPNPPPDQAAQQPMSGNNGTAVGTAAMSVNGTDPSAIAASGSSAAPTMSAAPTALGVGDGNTAPPPNPQQAINEHAERPGR